MPIETKIPNNVNKAPGFQIFFVTLRPLFFNTK